MDRYPILRSFKRALAMMLVAYACLLAPASADDDSDNSQKENRVKVAFLYNFVKFVEWPGTLSLGQTHTANICIIGDNPFGDTLAMLKQASTPQLTLNVMPDISAGSIPQCNILYISRSESGEVASLLTQARAHSVLTVSELSGFADNGGIIEMVKAEKTIGLFSKDKINLRINIKQAEAEGLRIDPQLLEIAAEVIK